MLFSIRFISCAILLFLLASCERPTERIEVKNEDGVVTERYTRWKEDFAREGLTERFDDQGQLLETAYYTKDTLHGERKLYYENGNVEYCERYEKGQYNGPYQAFHENGALKLEGLYVNNEMTGTWKRYYETGQLEEEVTFDHNQESGPFVEYYPNGKLKAKGAYEGGDFEQGPLELYNEEGILIRKMSCEKGLCRTTWKLETEPDESTDS